MRISHFVTHGHIVTLTNIYICNIFQVCLILINTELVIQANADKNM